MIEAVGGVFAVAVVTVMVAAALVAVNPASSVARAVSVYMPAATPLHVNAYGAVVSSPSLVAPLKNSTLATVPSASEALAARFTVVGAVKVARAAGCVSVTVGDDFTVNIVATEGTPFALRRNSMYMPGGAMLALAGAVAVRLVVPAVNFSGM